MPLSTFETEALTPIFSASVQSRILSNEDAAYISGRNFAGQELTAEENKTVLGFVFEDLLGELSQTPPKLDLWNQINATIHLKPEAGQTADKFAAIAPLFDSVNRFITEHPDRADDLVNAVKGNFINALISEEPDVVQTVQELVNGEITKLGGEVAAQQEPAPTQTPVPEGL